MDSRSVRHAIPPSNLDVLGRELAQAHNCLSGCPCCLTWTNGIGVPDPLDGWIEFVRSNSALRLASAHKNGLAFPPLSPDPVTQWLIEEACLLALQKAENSMPAEPDIDALEANANRALGL